MSKWDQPVSKPERTQFPDKIPYDLEHDTVFQLVAVKSADGSGDSGFKGAFFDLQCIVSNADFFTPGETYNLTLADADYKEEQLKHTKVKNGKNAGKTLAKDIRDKIMQGYIWNVRSLMAAIFKTTPENERIQPSKNITQLEGLAIAEQLCDKKLFIRMKNSSIGRGYESEYFTAKGDETESDLAKVRNKPAVKSQAAKVEDDDIPF